MLKVGIRKNLNIIHVMKDDSKSSKLIKNFSSKFCVFFSKAFDVDFFEKGT